MKQRINEFNKKMSAGLDSTLSQPCRDPNQGRVSTAQNEDEQVAGLMVVGVALSLLLIAICIGLIYKRLKKMRSRIPPMEDNFSEDETPSLDWENNFSPPLAAAGYHKHRYSDSQRGIKMGGMFPPSPKVPSAPPMMVATSKGQRAPTPGSDDPPPSYDEVFGSQQPGN